MGSSTACIASLDCGAGELEVANLGDSGALVVQPNGHVCLETKEQQHYFNCQMPRSEERLGTSFSWSWHVQWPMHVSSEVMAKVRISSSVCPLVVLGALP